MPTDFKIYTDSKYIKNIKGEHLRMNKTQY